MTDVANRRTAALLSAGYAVLLVVFTLQIKSELGQVLFNLIADFGFGYAVGSLLRGTSRPVLAGFAGALGFLVWLVIVFVELVFYQGAAAYPVGVWFVRFGLAGALFLAAGAFLGDAVARKKVTVTAAGLSAAAAVVGVIFTLIK
jgi:hypothetical protein